jgi:hypothetical protein
LTEVENHLGNLQSTSPLLLDQLSSAPDPDFAFDRRLKKVKSLFLQKKTADNSVVGVKMVILSEIGAGQDKRPYKRWKGENSPVDRDR